MSLFGKDVYTTGEVAKICNVAARTVSKWFDSGQIEGYRIPGSKDRRIPAGALAKFMKSHGIPFDGSMSGKTRVLVYDADKNARSTLVEALRNNTEFDVYESEDSFSAGLDCERLRPHVLLYASGISNSAFKNLRNCDEFAGTRIISMENKSDSSGFSVNTYQYCDRTLCKPFTVRDAIEAIEETTALVY